MIKITALLATTTTIAFVSPPVLAANFDVLMLNKGKAGVQVFEPALVEIEVGDTVTFIPTDKWHNAETSRA